MSLPERIAALVSSNGYPTIKIETGLVIVGRSPDCDVVVDSRKISRRHCCIAVGKGQLHLRDLGSTNGCWREGERLDDFSVVEGQEFTIGDAAYRFQWDHPSDHIMLPGASRKAAAKRENGPQTLPEPPVPRPSPEPSDPFLHLAGLA